MGIRSLFISGSSAKESIYEVGVYMVAKAFDMHNGEARVAKGLIFSQTNIGSRWIMQTENISAHSHTSTTLIFPQVDWLKISILRAANACLGFRTSKSIGGLIVNGCIIFCS
jgi:hypothetical protein